MTTFIAEGGISKVINREEMRELLLRGLEASGKDLSRLVIVPTDKTRKPGKAGVLTEDLYNSEKVSIADIYLALASHTMHTSDENKDMFGNVPQELFREHDWNNGVIKLGEVPDEYVKKVSGGENSKWHKAIPLQINREFYSGLKNKKYSAAVSIGPVFPHEVVGFSNGLKNILVGLGGKDFVDASHFLGAVYGMEKMMGRLETPTRQVFNYAHEHCLKELGIIYALTVLDKEQNVRGLYIGDDIETHAQAAGLSKQLNVDVVDKPLENVVVYLDPSEFTSFWLCNKAVYRTRMGMADDGQLTAIAPALKSYSDDPEKNPEMDQLIARHGYFSTPNVLKALDEDSELAANLSVAAHLIHGSPERRFNVTFATDPDLMPEERVKRVGFNWMDASNALKTYDISRLKPGLDVEKGVYFIPDPSNVLLSTKEKMNEK